MLKLIINIIKLSPIWVKVYVLATLLIFSYLIYERDYISAFIVVILFLLMAIIEMQRATIDFYKKLCRKEG